MKPSVTPSPYPLQVLTSIICPTQHSSYKPSYLQLFHPSDLMNSKSYLKNRVSFYWPRLLKFHLHFGSACQQIIQVRLNLWFPVKVQIFVQHSLQVPNHQICNHFTILSFWTMLLVYIQVNIQGCPQSCLIHFSLLRFRITLFLVVISQTPN